MPAPAAGNIVQVTIRRLDDAQMVENVIHMRERTGTSTEEQIDASVEALRQIFRPITSAEITFLDTFWKYLTPVPLDGRFVPPEGGTEAGSIGSFRTNSTLAVVVSMRTGTAGKRHRGRMYLPIASSHQALNRLHATGVADYATFCAEMLSQFSDGSGSDEHLALGIYSRVIGGTRPPTVAGWQAVTAMAAGDIIGNQRRRRVGVGI